MQAMTLATMLLMIGVLALAGFTQGLTGFGFGLTAMGLLPRVLTLDEAQTVVTLTSLAACLTMALMTFRQVQWSCVGRLWLGSAAGVPLGFLLLTALEPSPALRVLGLAICLLVVFEAIVMRHYKIHFPAWSVWFIGLASGMLSGAFNIGGPPLVVYIFDHPWPKEQKVATLSALFLSGGLIRLMLLLYHDRIPAESWTSAACAIGPIWAAIFCGNRLLRFVSQPQLRIGVHTALFALGSHYLLAG
jgi:uncharacterized membrane protein YfcA